MKPIRVMMDEEVLRRLDRDEEVRRRGRSAVLRQAASEYLRRSTTRRIAKVYRKAYGKSAGLGADFSGWENEGT